MDLAQIIFAVVFIMSEIVLRPAKKSDSADLALLDNLAGHGISLWFWQKAMGATRLGDAFIHGKNRLATDDAFYGWRSITVAVDKDDCILGSVCSYINPEQDEDAAQIKRSAPVFVPVFELSELVTGTWLVDVLAVYPNVQNKGIGKKLLDDSLKRAGEMGSKIASLVTEDTNENAIGLYKSRGFETIDTRKYIEFDGPAKTKEWLLMTKQL